MSLEKALLKTIQEYEELLRLEKASPEEILRVHQRMKILRGRLDYRKDFGTGNNRLVTAYKIAHLNSRVIRMEHSTSTSHIDPTQPDGEIEIQYLWRDQTVSGVYLFALDYFFSRSDETGEWWHKTKDDLGDYGRNETKFGFMHVLKAEGSGSFWSSEVRALDKKNANGDFEQQLRIFQERAARKVKLGLWDACLKDEAIRGLTVSRVSLEKGDLTAFFDHIGYQLLDQFYSEAVK